MRLRSPNCDTFFNSSFQIHYDSEDRTEFIETADHKSFKVEFNGHTLHKVPAETVAAFLSKFAPGRWEERKHTYIVPSLQLAFWRPVIPEPDQSPNDANGRYFESVGAGRRGYFPEHATGG
jgi:hypothetical protein